MNALEDEYDLQVVNIAFNILNLLLSPADCFSNQPDRREDSVEVELPNTQPVKESKNIFIPNLCVNFTPIPKRPSHYINEENFLNKYNKTNFEKIKSDKLAPNETLNLENLIHHFKKVTFDVSVNEKDCY